MGEEQRKERNCIAPQEMIVLITEKRSIQRVLEAIMVLAYEKYEYWLVLSWEF